MQTLKAKCDNPWAYMFGVPIWQHNKKLPEFKKKFCDEYNAALGKHNENYSSIEFASWYVDMYSWTGEKIDDLWLSKIISYFSANYSSWYQFIAWDMQECKNPIFLREWDFLVYIPFFLICFYIIKYIFF